MDRDTLNAIAVAAASEKFNREFLQDSHLEARDALRAIVHARDLAPDVQLPTPLMCAIEAARRVVA